MGILSFLDDTREWMKARRNVDRPALPMEDSFGAHILSDAGLLVVEDPHTDTRFKNNPLVSGPPGIRFYAGAPIIPPDSPPIGTIAVLDTAPRTPDDELLAQLETLASLVVETLEARRPVLSRTTSSDPGDSNTVVLDEDGLLLQADEGWTSFALQNNLDDLASLERGANYLQAWEVALDSTEEAFAVQARKGIEAVLDDEQSAFEMVYPCHGPNQKRWLQMRALRLDHPEARAIVTHQNITDRREQRRQRRVLETAVEQAREVVLITEGAPLTPPGPRITYVNPAFTEVTGYEPEEVIGKTPRILQGPATEPWVLDEMRKRLEQGEPFEGEAINYRKDGRPYINQWSIAPVHDDDGTLTHWVSVQRDVSQERQMEKQLLKAQERERKRISKTMHDEMGGLLASLQMSIDGTQAEGDDSSFQDVQHVANQLSSVVRTLTERLHSRVLDDYGLSRALPRLADQFREHEGLDIDIHDELSPDAPLPPLLEKIAYRGVHEALSNVARHADTNWVQVIINRETRKIRIHVIDDGTGFNPATELNTDDQHGLLGLRERVVRLNGKLDIDSAAEAGTRVSMTLPLTLVSLLEQTEPR